MARHKHRQTTRRPHRAKVPHPHRDDAHKLHRESKRSRKSRRGKRKRKRSHLYGAALAAYRAARRRGGPKPRSRFLPTWLLRSRGERMLALAEKRERRG